MSDQSTGVCPECGLEPSDIDDLACKNIGACRWWWDGDDACWHRAPPLWQALQVDNKTLQTENEAMASSLEAQSRTLTEQNEDTLKLMERAKAVEGAEAFAADLETRLEHREVELDDLRRVTENKLADKAKDCAQVSEANHELARQNDELKAAAGGVTGVDLANALDSYAVNVARRVKPGDDDAMITFPTHVIQVAQLLRNRATETSAGIADSLDYLARGC